MEHKPGPLVILSLLVVSAMFWAPVAATPTGASPAAAGTAAASQGFLLRGASPAASAQSPPRGARLPAQILPPQAPQVSPQPVGMAPRYASQPSGPSASDAPPQLVSTTASNYATSSSPERKLFYSLGYWWAFWEQNSGDFVYSSSPDEVTWSAPAVVASGLANACDCASVWVSAGTAYYAQGTGLQNFTYDAGSLNPDGTIAWATPTTVPTEYNTQNSISVVTDALGDPWVAAYTENGPSQFGPQFVEVYEYSNGAWSASANSPIAAPDFGGEYLAGWAQVVPLPELSATVPGVAVLYSFVDCTLCFSGVSLQYTYLSGGAMAWSSPVAAGPDFAEFSATAVGDTIYIAGSYGFGGVEFSSYTTGQPAASTPLSIAPGTSWGNYPPNPGTELSISQGAPGSDALAIFYVDSTGQNLDYSISTDLGATWGAAQSLYSSPQTLVAAVSSSDAATSADEFAVLFTSYAGVFDLEFAAVSVSLSTGVSVSITLDPSSGTSGPINATNYFSVAYTSGGLAQTADQVGGALVLSVDPSTTVTVSATSSGSGATEEWCLYLCGADAFSSGTSGASVTLTYYQQYLEQVSYSTSGGGPPPGWCPVYPSLPCYENFLYSSAGLPLSVPLTTAPTAVFVDAGTTWSVTDPAFGSSLSEGWFAVPATSTITSGPATADAVTISGTVASAGVVALVYYHEYSVEAGYSTSSGTPLTATVTLDGTQSGVSVALAILAAPTPSFLDSGSSWSISPSVVSMSSTERYALASGGTGSVDAAGQTVAAAYQEEYLVTFAFSGTPAAGQSIQVDGQAAPAGGAWEDSGATISISLTSDSSFSAWQSSTTSISIADPSSASTTAAVGGAGSVTAVLTALYPVVFEEEGLPSGRPWSVVLDGTTMGSSTQAITFSESNHATYQYSVPCVSELCPVSPSGQVTLDVGGAGGLPVVIVQFLAPWPSYLRDGQQTDASPYVAAQAAKLEWTFLAGDATSLTGGVCPPPTSGGESYYEECVGQSEVSSPTVGPDGTIYFAVLGGSGGVLGQTNLYAGNLFALNPDGSLKWAFDTQGGIAGPAPAVGPDGTVYIGTVQQGDLAALSGENSLLAINPEGTLKWGISLPSGPYGAGEFSFQISPDGGTIYADGGPVLYAISANGFVEWQDSVGSISYLGNGLFYNTGIYSSPVIGPTGEVYVVGTSAQYGVTLYALNADGTVSWEAGASVSGVGGPAIGPDGVVYAGCQDTSICAYNPDGTLRWSATIPLAACDIPPPLPGITGVPQDTPCTYTNAPSTTLVMGPAGTVLVATREVWTATSGTTTMQGIGWSILYALSAADGSTQWSVTPSEPIVQPPAVGADGTIYMGCGFDVCAYSSAGTELWDLNLSGALGSLGPSDVQGTAGMNTAPAIGTDGTVYMGDVYGHLFAIGPGPSGPQTQPSELLFTLHSPVNILVTLPNGEQAGFDSSGTEVNTAGATITAPGPGQLETVRLDTPGQGQYEMQVFGTGSGPFTVSAQSFGPDGSQLGASDYSGVASTGSEQTLYLGLVAGGQMSVLLTAHLTGTGLAMECLPSSVQDGETATCYAFLSGETGSVVGETIGFSLTEGTGTASLPSPAQCTIVSGSECSIGVAATGPGSVTVQAVYGGDSSNSGSSAAGYLAITTAQTSTSVACDPSSVTAGAQSTCTATVSGAYGSTDGEAVSFSSSGPGGFDSATCTLSSGSCSVHYTPTSASGSPQSIAASYPGDAGNSGSSGAASLGVDEATSTTAVSCAAASLPVGTGTSCTATVTGFSPSGTITWSQSSGDGGSVAFSSATCGLSGSSCSVMATGATAGSVSIEAAYGGDPNNAASSSTAGVTVSQPNSIPQLIATVDGMHLPQGLTQSLDAKLHAALSAFNSDDYAEAVNQLNAFVDEARAQSGKALTQTQSQLLTSDAESLISSISQLTSIALTCYPSRVFVGSSTQCFAIVGADGGQPLTGSVAFTSSDAGGAFSGATCGGSSQHGDAREGAGTLLICGAEYTPSSIGTQTLTATYPGDARHSSSSATLRLYVTLIPTSTSLRCGPPQAGAGNTVRCEADVTSQSGDSPGGAVTFTSSDPHGAFGTATCSTRGGSGAPYDQRRSEVLVCLVNYAPSAAHGPTTITAAYQGDASHSSSAATFRLYSGDGGDAVPRARSIPGN